MNVFDQVKNDFIDFLKTINLEKKIEILTKENEKLQQENDRLKKIIAKELNENDELGSEFVYINILKEEKRILREAFKDILGCSGCVAWYDEEGQEKAVDERIKRQKAIERLDRIRKIRKEKVNKNDYR